jgi:hypothetical protein
MGLFNKKIVDTISKKTDNEKEMINFLNKREKLIYLFSYESKLPIVFILEKTGIKSEHSLRTYLTDLRKRKIIFLRQKFGFIEKVKK